MARAVRKAKVRQAAAVKAPLHTKLDSFEDIKGIVISSVDDLAQLMEKYGIHRLYIRSPNQRSLVKDTAEAAEGTWQVGVKMNNMLYDYGRSEGCTTLHEALEGAIGVRVLPERDCAQPHEPISPPVTDDNELLV